MSHIFKTEQVARELADRIRKLAINPNRGNHSNFYLDSDKTKFADHFVKGTYRVMNRFGGGFFRTAPYVISEIEWLDQTPDSYVGEMDRLKRENILPLGMHGYVSCEIVNKEDKANLTNALETLLSMGCPIERIVLVHDKIYYFSPNELEINPPIGSDEWLKERFPDGKFHT